MDALNEAIEICESMMAHKDRNGLGRLHVLLCIVKERCFLGDEDDTAELPRCPHCGEPFDGETPYCSWGCHAAAEEWDCEVRIVDDTPFPAA